MVEGELREEEEKMVGQSRVGRLSCVCSGVEIRTVIVPNRTPVTKERVYPYYY